jgi:YVTN family beta-propeller protein/autotransporter-associated beta strand protein
LIVTSQTKNMKERKTLSCASSVAAFSTSARQVGGALDTARWVFAAVLGACLWAAGFCDAQIQVNAYIPDASVTNFGNSATFNQGRVFVIDTATNQSVGSPISVGFLPAGVSVTPDGRYVYITNNGSNTISVIDSVSRAVVGSINVPTGPIGVATSPDAKQVYATSPGFIPDNRGFAGNTVSIVNTAKNTLAGAITPGIGPIGVAFTPDGAHAYVANSSSNSVSVINTATKSVALSIPVGNSPTGVAMSPNGQYVYVANQSNNGNGASPGTVSVISTATNGVAFSIPVGNSPTGVAISPSGQYVYVTNMNNGNGGAGTVSVINTATNTVVSTITVGISPIGISVTPDGKYVYVANSNINNGGRGPLVGIVSVISTASNTVVALIPVGTAPLSFGSFISPNIIVAQGGPLLVANDAALTALGFQQFVDFNGGTIRLTGDWVTSRMVSLLAQGGTIDTNGFNASLSGAIINPGSLTKLGAGTLTLSGANTYEGGTNILGGTILTQNASALGTGPVAFGNGTTLEVQHLLNVNGNWTVFPGTATVNGGIVQTFGDFNLGGGGTLIANANFNVPGVANIDSSGLVVRSQFTVAGDLNLNGSSQVIVYGALTASDVNVGQSALFMGTGVVKGNVINSGMVAPGASVGRLTVNGNYTQNASGALRVEVAGSAPGQYDVLAVNGHASLAGTLQLVSVGGFTLRSGDQIAFLTASNGVSGTFGNVESDILTTGSMLAFNVVYLPNGVLLEGAQASFAQFASMFCGTPNSVSVGRALDSAVGDPRAAGLIDFLDNETLSNLCNDFDLISPEELTSIYVIGVSLANVQTANLERRMDDIQAGSHGFSSSGFAINGSGPSFNQGFAGVSGSEGKSGQPVFAPIPENRWGVFATGVGEFTNVDSTFNASGYNLETGGFTMGIDYRIGSNFAIGLTGGYAYTGANLVNDGSIRANGGKLGLYATAFGSGFYLDTAVIGGLNGYDTRRTALAGTASGSTEGGDLNVLVAGGYDWKKGGLTIGPTASFQYTYVGFGAFTESGSLAPLAFPDQHADSLRTALGMKGSYDWKIGPVHLVPEIRAAWQHEFGNTDYSLIASFANGAGSSFTVNGPEIGRDSLLLSAGFSVQWSDRISTYAYYDGELFRTNYLSNNVSAGFRVTF